MSILDSALYAARLGFHVFPLDPGCKTPYTLHGGRRMKWSAAATLSERTIRQWWSVSPDANYGIAAAPSGLLIIDCDTGKGTPPPASYAGEVRNGEDLFVMMCYRAAGYFPLETLTVNTPSGGSHWYYWNRDNRKMTNAPLYPDWLDVRANGGDEGGYVVGPGSMIDGKVYRPFTLAVDKRIMEAPGWLLDMCAAKPRPQRPKPHLGRFGQPASPVEGLMRSVRTAVDGNQGAAMYWAACSLRDDGYSMAEALDLLSANMPPDTRPNEPWTYRHVESTVHSAYK